MTNETKWGPWDSHDSHWDSWTGFSIFQLFTPPPPPECLSAVNLNTDSRDQPLKSKAHPKHRWPTLCTVPEHLMCRHRWTGDSLTGEKMMPDILWNYTLHHFNLTDCAVIYSLFWGQSVSCPFMCLCEHESTTQLRLSDTVSRVTAELWWWAWGNTQPALWVFFSGCRVLAVGFKLPSVFSTTVQCMNQSLDSTSSCTDSPSSTLPVHMALQTLCRGSCTKSLLVDSVLVSLWILASWFLHLLPADSAAALWWSYTTFTACILCQNTILYCTLLVIFFLFLLLSLQVASTTTWVLRVSHDFLFVFCNF